jgi:hypothetical protein
MGLMNQIEKLAREASEALAPQHRYHDLVQACFEKGFEEGFRKAISMAGRIGIDPVEEEMAGNPGIEPGTSALTVQRSAAELIPN